MLYLDIETNLAHDTIWCCVLKENDEFSVYMSSDGLQERLDAADIIVGHNIIGFDARVLLDVWGIYIPLFKMKDTLVLSRLYDTQRKSHKLASWGKQLNFPKDDFEDFDGGFSEEMLTYCKKDVDVLIRLDEALTMLSCDFAVNNSVLEHKVASIICQQEQNGFKLDIGKATALWHKFEEEAKKIEEELQEVFPPLTIERVSEKTGKRLKDHIEVFNIESRQQIYKRLLTLGAVFNAKTEKGNFIVNEKVLKALNMPEADRICQYLLLKKRFAQVENWLKHCGADGRIHGRVITNGAVTGRMTHLSPNMAQVPSVKTEYGEECRSCWIVDKGNVLVGADASGLELRMLAHFMNNEEYTNEILSGDIHTANQKAAGLKTRDQAKTFIYAFLYGAGAGKIGEIVGGDYREGGRLIKTFLDNMPSLKKLREDTIKEAEKGWIRGLDGRKLVVRSFHSALNTKLQAAGAIIMKQALVILNDRLVEQSIPHWFVANVHDEWQIECPESEGDKIGREAVKAIREAGRFFSLNCPLDGEYKIGKNWAETH